VRVRSQYINSGREKQRPSTQKKIALQKELL
jgi:hypothetical protein